MKALVQMLTNGEGVYFVAATEADDDGTFRLFSWGDVVGHISTPYQHVRICDEAFVRFTANPLTGWWCDGAPVVTPVPCILAREDLVVWAQRATKAMEEYVMARLAPMALYEQILGMGSTPLTAPWSASASVPIIPGGFAWSSDE